VRVTLEKYGVKTSST